MKYLVQILLIAICFVNTSYAAEEVAQTDQEIKDLVEKKPEMTNLILGGKEVTDKGMRYLVKLQSLSLSGDKLTSSDLVHLQALSELTSLDFHHVAVTDAGLDHLKTLKNLNFIGFRRAEVTASAIIALRKAIPKLRVSNVKPILIDVFDKDGKVRDMNSSFSLMLSNTSIGFDGKDAVATGGENLNLEKQVVILINDKKIASYTGGGILVPLNRHFQNKTILAGDNILTVKALPDVPLYLKIIESGANKQFRRFLVKEILKREDAETEKSFSFRVVTTVGK